MAQYQRIVYPQNRRECGKESPPPDKEKRISPVGRLFLAAVGFYRRYLSHLKGRPTCKYYPTCSQYAVDAITEYGALRGGCMAAWRLLRCNPFSRGGIDMVPPRKDDRNTGSGKVSKKRRNREIITEQN